MVNVVHPLKGVGVDGGEITRREPNHSLEHPPPNRLESARTSLSPTESITHREQGLRENQGELAILRGQVSVSARHGQAVRIPHRWRDKNPHRKIQVPHHRLHCCCLLEILLA